MFEIFSETADLATVPLVEVRVKIWKIACVLLLLSACSLPAIPREPDTTAVGPGDETIALTKYLMDTPLPVVDRTWLVNDTIDLSATTDKRITFTERGLLKRTARSPERTLPVVKLNDASNVRISGLKIQGPLTCDNGVPVYDPNTEAQHGIEIIGSNNISISGGYVKGMPGDAIYVAGQTSDLDIHNMTLECSGRSSMSNTGSFRVRSSNVAYDKAGLWHINIEPVAEAIVDQYTIIQPMIGPSGSVWLWSGGPDFNCHVSNVNVHQPSFWDGRWYGISAYGCVIDDIIVHP